jgi:hypothetical protein
MFIDTLFVLWHLFESFFLLIVKKISPTYEWKVVGSNVRKLFKNDSMLTSDKNKHREKTSSNENKLYATSVLILSINDEQCSSIWCSVASTSTEHFNCAEPEHVLEHEHWALGLNIKTNKYYLKSKFYSYVMKD